MNNDRTRENTTKYIQKKQEESKKLKRILFFKQKLPVEVSKFIKNPEKLTLVLVCDLVCDLLPLTIQQ